MNNTDISAHMELAKECGAITYTHRSNPHEAAVSFGPAAWAKFVEASARQLAEQPGHLLIAAERWAQLEHMWSRNATPETIASYIGRPEILDRISKIRREHEAAVQGNAA